MRRRRLDALTKSKFDLLWRHKSTGSESLATQHLLLVLGQQQLQLACKLCDNPASLCDNQVWPVALWVILLQVVVCLKRVLKHSGSLKQLFLQGLVLCTKQDVGLQDPAHKHSKMLSKKLLCPTTLHLRPQNTLFVHFFTLYPDPPILCPDPPILFPAFSVHKASAAP